MLVLAIQNVIAAAANIIGDSLAVRLFDVDQAFMVTAATVLAQGVALSAIIPEIIVIRGIRSNLDKEKQALDESLNDLQDILRNAKSARMVAEILAQEAE